MIENETGLDDIIHRTKSAPVTFKRYVGYICIGGKNKKEADVSIAFYNKPNWLKRQAYRYLLGWEWSDE
jgi:hypothetical protein